MAERQITIQREVAEQEVKVERENVIINNIDNITGVFPEGTREITENGNYNVTTYERVDVQVPGIDEIFNRVITPKNYDHFLSRRLINTIPTIEIDSTCTALSYAFAAYTQQTAPNLKIVGDGTNVTFLDYAFYSSGSIQSLDLSEVTFPRVTRLERAFGGMTNLKSLDISKVLSGAIIAGSMNGAFESLRGIEELKLPSDWDTSGVTTMNYAFQYFGYDGGGVARLDVSSIDTSGVTSNSTIFQNARIRALIIDRQQVFKLTAASCLNGSLIAQGKGYVYVPDNMVDAYKADTYWGVYPNQIKPLSELPEE